MDLTDDEHLTRSMTELGDPDVFFRISRGRFLAKLAVGVLLLVYGVAANYLWWVHGPAQFDHLSFFLLFIIPLSGGALHLQGDVPDLAPREGVHLAAL